MKHAHTLLALAVLALAGCSTHNTTLMREFGPGQVIYRISEEQAFRITLDAFALVLPNQSLRDIPGGRRGYESTYRWGLDTYSQRVLVIPGTGTSPHGQEVQGYWFEVSGSGTSTPGRLKNHDLFRRLQEILDSTGTATVVTNVKEGRYETDGRAYRASGRDAVEAAASRSQAPARGGVADQLRELQTLHEQGLISDQEYEAKRRQILDRM